MQLALDMGNLVTAKGKKRTQSGRSTSDVICSAYMENNNSVFVDILKLHVKEGSEIADVTFGKGVFWKDVNLEKYKLYPSDLWLKKETLKKYSNLNPQTGIDCRNLPYQNESLDCIVLDPPYMESFYRNDDNHIGGTGTHSSFREAYSSVGGFEKSEKKWHEAVIDIYEKAGLEAFRVLKPGGCVIVKCQDEISANLQRLTHVEIISAYESLGFYTKDLFVVVRTNKPAVSRILVQKHARKNHSYFLVFVKQKSRVKNVRVLKPVGQGEKIHPKQREAEVSKL